MGSYKYGPKTKFLSFCGFDVGQRISSDGSLGTVVDPEYEPDDPNDDLIDCVPVIMDGNIGINWFRARNLRKV